MRLLVVLTYYPFPPRTGSTIFAYNSLKQLSKDHEIDLVCFRPEQVLFDPAEFVKRLVLIVHKKPRGVVLWVRHLLYMMAGVPPSVSAFVSNAMRNKVKELIESYKYDAIL